MTDYYFRHRFPHNDEATVAECSRVNWSTVKAWINGSTTKLTDSTFEDITACCDAYYASVLKLGDPMFDGMDYQIETQSGKVLHYAAFGSLWKPPPLVIRKTPLEI